MGGGGCGEGAEGEEGFGGMGEGGEGGAEGCEEGHFLWVGWRGVMWVMIEIYDEVLLVGRVGLWFCVMKAESRRLRRAWRGEGVANQGLEPEVWISYAKNTVTV